MAQSNRLIYAARVDAVIRDTLAEPDVHEHWDSDSTARRRQRSSTRSSPALHSGSRGGCSRLAAASAITRAGSWTVGCP